MEGHFCKLRASILDWEGCAWLMAKDIGHSCDALASRLCQHVLTLYLRHGNEYGCFNESLLSGYLRVLEHTAFEYDWNTAIAWSVHIYEVRKHWSFFVS